MAEPAGGLDYRAAGVDLDEAGQAEKALKSLVARPKGSRELA